MLSLKINEVRSNSLQMIQFVVGHLVSSPYGPENNKTHKLKYLRSMTLGCKDIAIRNNVKTVNPWFQYKSSIKDSFNKIIQKLEMMK